jgi:hypothetical protein
MAHFYSKHDTNHKVLALIKEEAVPCPVHKPEVQVFNSQQKCLYFFGNQIYSYS